MKNKMKLMTLVGGAGMLLSTISVGGTASAATASPTYGFDGNAHIIVGGGSDTTYQAMLAISNLYDYSSIGGCAANTSVSNGAPAMNSCLTTGGAPASAAPTANYDRDTVVQAAPTGSSAGIASLNGSNGTNAPPSYEGTATGSVNFARSSRTYKSSGGDCSQNSGDELSCDTFWGFAEDGVEVFSFGTHGGTKLTPAQLLAIWTCADSTWGQIDGNSADTAPIVPWAMNTSSGTYATFNTYINNAGLGTTTFAVDNAQTSGSPYAPTYGSGGKCVRPLSTNAQPFENDVKPLFSDVDNNQGGITTSGVNDPDNWVWFGSYGLLSAFPYDSNYTDNAGTAFSAVPSAIQNPAGSYVTPGPSSILLQKYPIDRTLYHVTAKTDADCPVTNGSCNFTANPGVTLPSGEQDLNVLGGTSGTSGAVREFTRFLCRADEGQDPADPYTGKNLYDEVQAARAASGFTAVPTALQSPGSACAVSSVG